MTSDGVQTSEQRFLTARRLRLGVGMALAAIPMFWGFWLGATASTNQQESAYITIGITVTVVLLITLFMGTLLGDMKDE